jgi:hypothetical protein
MIDIWTAKPYSLRAWIGTALLMLAAALTTTLILFA